MAEDPTGTLIVDVRSIYDHDDISTFKLALSKDIRVIPERIEVSAELTSAPAGGVPITRASSYGDSRYTQNGKVAWSGIPAGTYQVEVSIPDGYGLSGFRGGLNGNKNGLQPFGTITVLADQTSTLTAFLYPLLSAVAVNAFWDQDRTGDPCDQTPLDNTQARFHWQDKTVPSTTLVEFLNNAKIADANAAEKKAKSSANNPSAPTSPNSPGLIREHVLGADLSNALDGFSPDDADVYLLLWSGLIHLHSAGTAVVEGVKLRPSTPLAMVSLVRGGVTRALVPFVESLNEIEVSGHLVGDAAHGSQNGSKRAKPVSLPSVVYGIYRGVQQGEPFRQGTSNGSVPHLFSDLPDGNYTVVAMQWPTSYGGFGQIRPMDPPSGIYSTLSITGGQRVQLPFLFAPCLSAVNGVVTNGQPSVGVSDVPLTLALASGQPMPSYHARTNRAGEYEFTGVIPGNYVVSIEEEKINIGNGRTLEVPSAAQTGYPVTVSACATVSVPAIVLEEEIHRIFGTATAPDGSILPFLRVEIQDQKGRLVVATQTDQNGFYEVLLQQAGFYLVVPKADSGLQIPAQVNSEVQIDILTASAAGASGPGSRAAAAKNNDMIEAEIDNQAYPVLTEEVPTDMISRSSSFGGSGGGSMGLAPIGKMAENAIRDVLSWRAKVNDPKSFMLALNQSFALKDVEGHTEFTWTPRTYTVQTDMGAITGAQASIYARAKVALDQSMPLLDGLYALLPTLNQEDLDSVREMVRSLFTELVNDFGIEGGPRVARVNQLFNLLLGPPPVPTNTETAQGQLGILRERFNLKREFITTIADKQNLTNYMVLVDYVIGLANSWNAQKVYFARSGTGGAEPFFGTQLVLLSRALDVVAQSVKDVYFAMDSVFLGAAERQTILLDFTSIGGESSMFVAELLDWVDRAASQELPQQLQDSGKDAIGAMKHVLANLHRFVRTALLPTQPFKGLPPGYRTPRVQRAMRELAQQLHETLKLANQVKSPDFPEEA